MLKDNLKCPIEVNGERFYSIKEILLADYNKYKIDGKGFDLGCYRGGLITFEIGEDENISMYELIKNQISTINEINNI